MKKISKEIFTPYLHEPDSIRPMLEKPFPCNGYVCATDTRILLLIRKDLLEDKFEVVKHTPDVAKIIPAHNCALTLTRATILSTINTLPMEEIMKETIPEVPCMECDGDGQVEWKYEDRNHNEHSQWFECPCCSGSGVKEKAVFEPTGKKVPAPLALVVLNGVCVWGTTLQTLLDTMHFLDIKEVTIKSLNPRDPCLIRIAEGIYFIFMPVVEFDLNLTTAVQHLNIMPVSVRKQDDAYAVPETPS